MHVWGHLEKLKKVSARLTFSSVKVTVSIQILTNDGTVTVVPIPTTDFAVLMLCSFSASSMFFTVFIICYEFYEVLCNNLIGKKTGNLL